MEQILDPKDMKFDPKKHAMLVPEMPIGLEKPAGY